MISRDDLCVRDPYVYIENDNYYLFGTYGMQTNANGYRQLICYTSKDLLNFEGPFVVFETYEEFWGRKYLWAPELYKHNDKYYLFVTFHNDGITGTQVLVSDNVLGPYKPISNEPITPKEWDCIDASLFVENNVCYISFVRSWAETVNGEMYLAKASRDLTHLIEEPKLIFRARDAKWASRTDKSEDGGVTDAPFIFKRDNKYHMLWSSYHDNIYALSDITSDNLYGPWKQEETPYLLEDSGHGMIFIDKEKVYLAIHKPNKPFSKGIERLQIREFASTTEGFEIIANKKIK